MNKQTAVSLIIILLTVLVVLYAALVVAKSADAVFRPDTIAEAMRHLPPELRQMNPISRFGD